MKEACIFLSILFSSVEEIAEGQQTKNNAQVKAVKIEVNFV